MEITTIGLDLAKRVFQVHGVDAAGRVVVRKCWLVFVELIMQHRLNNRIAAKCAATNNEPA
jgi:hypothetical protein